MDLLSQIRLSLKSYWRAFRFIDDHNLWTLLIIPAVINMILTLIMIIFAIRTSRLVVDFVLQHFQITTPDATMHHLVEGLIMVIVRAFVFFLYLKVYRYLMLIALAPTLAILSSRVQTIDFGPAKTSCTSKYLLDCSRGIKIALRNFMIEIVLSTFIIALCLVIAWAIPLAPIAVLLLESYFVGYSMADYRHEYFGISSRESRKQINNYPGLVVGNGLWFNLLLLVPLLGILFAPTFALVASGLSINYIEKRKSESCKSNQSTLMMAR
ncbi:MAG: hypothetical protein HC819_04150 [Cyclobacteriaceae bacterium]|nr:hypothetical protein [Cyclobacteriaceae bacterium]